MQAIGYDVGSSFVKASVLDVETGIILGSSFAPKAEMEITALRSGWAEQEPELWWTYLKEATRELLSNDRILPDRIEAIGISYQMHGLVAVDKDHGVIRPSIIWCDSRAVEIGEKAFRELGAGKCLPELLNSPGNFTASKLKWVKENEPDLYEKIFKIMLPGDFIAMKLTGEIKTTITGLSEGILWNFPEHTCSKTILEYYGLEERFIPDVVPSFSVQGTVIRPIAEELGLPPGIPVSYRAGDQPNNAFSLNVLNPGEIAATAGTSGVVYGVSEEVRYDPKSRVNSFAHVNHSDEMVRIGVLLCINGTGILNSWLKRVIAFPDISYDRMNREGAEAPLGSAELTILPFGNGAERMLGNRDPGCRLNHLNFNIHDRRHLFRAAQEGIVFSFRYGMDIMEETGIKPEVIRAGMANMFLSPLFREALSTLANARIELYNTDGSAGAARGAVVGAGIVKPEEVFTGLEKTLEVEPDRQLFEPYAEAFNHWKDDLNNYLNNS